MLIARLGFQNGLGRFQTKLFRQQKQTMTTGIYLFLSQTVAMINISWKVVQRAFQITFWNVTKCKMGKECHTHPFTVRSMCLGGESLHVGGYKTTHFLVSWNLSSAAGKKKIQAVCLQQSSSDSRVPLGNSLRIVVAKAMAGSWWLRASPSSSGTHGTPPPPHHQCSRHNVHPRHKCPYATFAFITMETFMILQRKHGSWWSRRAFLPHCLTGSLKGEETANAIYLSVSRHGQLKKKSKPKFTLGMYNHNSHIYF